MLFRKKKDKKYCLTVHFFDGTGDSFTIEGYHCDQNFMYITPWNEGDILVRGISIGLIKDYYLRVLEDA